MKTIFSIIILLTGLSSYSQDVIYKKDGTQIQAKVAEVTVAVIKYKKFTNQTGPTYEISKSDLIKIVYPDGSVDDFAKEAESSQKNTADRIQQMMKAQINSRLKSNGKTTVKLNGQDYTTEYNELRVAEAGRQTGLVTRNRSAVVIWLTTTLTNGDKKIQLKFTLTENDMKPKTFKSPRNNTLENVDGQFMTEIEYLNPNVNMGVVGNKVVINNIKNGKFTIDSIDTVNRTITGSYQITGTSMDRGTVDIDGTFTNISY